MAGQQPTLPEPHYGAFALRFRRNANSLAVRYGAHVVLVGGALTDEDPRDYDVRIVLSDADFMVLYGGTLYRNRPAEALFDYELWEWKRGYDCLKLSRLMTHRMCVPVDFCIQAESEARVHEGKPKIRLDTAPDWVLRVGREE